MEGKVGEEFLFSCEVHTLLVVATDDSPSELSLSGSGKVTALGMDSLL
jgi:hypothetical protein